MGQGGTTNSSNLKSRDGQVIIKVSVANEFSVVLPA